MPSSFPICFSQPEPGKLIIRLSSKRDLERVYRSWVVSVILVKKKLEISGIIWSFWAYQFNDPNSFPGPGVDR
jgi:hypothetical protein